MLTKTKAAFLMSAFRFFDTFPKVYFWTFTWKDVRNDDWYMYQWNLMLRDFQDHYGKKLVGLRVVEAAEGGHGLHFHVLLNQRFSIHIIKRLGRRYGLGRVSVVKADEGAAWYLSKYMGKNSLPLADGVRRWGALGGFKPTRCRDIQCDSQLSRNIKWVQSKAQVRQINYSGFLYIGRMTKLYGAVTDWPKIKLSYVSTERAIQAKKWIPYKYRKQTVCHPF